MFESNDMAYYLRRERDCRARAERASDRSIGAIHVQMADAYRRRIDGDVDMVDDPGSRMPMPMPIVRIAAG